MSSSLFIGSLILITLAVGCNAPDQQSAGTQAAPGSADGDPSIVHHPEPPARAAEKTDSISLEGTFERINVRLVQTENPPRFSTYVPEDFIYEPTSSDEGDGHFFFTNFAGKRNDDAYVLVFIYPPNTTEGQARKLTESFVTSRAPLVGPTLPDRTYQESLFERAFFFRRGNLRFFGFIALAKHGERYFHFAMQYPAEFGDGFGPRADYIRKQWVWLDDGQGLGLTSPPPRGSPE